MTGRRATQRGLLSAAKSKALRTVPVDTLSLHPAPLQHAGAAAGGTGAGEEQLGMVDLELAWLVYKREMVNAINIIKEHL